MYAEAQRLGVGYAWLGGARAAVGQPWAWADDLPGSAPAPSLNCGSSSCSLWAYAQPRYGSPAPPGVFFWRHGGACVAAPVRKTLVPRSGDACVVRLFFFFIFLHFSLGPLLLAGSAGSTHLNVVLAVNAGPHGGRFAGLSAADREVALAYVCEMDVPPRRPRQR